MTFVFVAQQYYPGFEREGELISRTGNQVFQNTAVAVEMCVVMEASYRETYRKLDPECWNGEYGKYN